MNNELDKWDVIVSISSGAITAAIDILWIGDISLVDAHKWGSEKVDEFVISVAKSKGYKGKEIAGAIKKLEDDFPMDGDLLTKEFGSGSQHHLRDFSHHPTIVGLIFSLLMQFTGKGYGTKTNGEFVSFDIPGWKPRSFVDSVYVGTIEWLFHIISDIAGSSGTRRIENKEGTGLPGPLLSFLKEISAIPGIRSIAGKTDPKSSPNKEEYYQFSVTCSKLFNGTLLGEHDEKGKPVLHKELKFDLRTELGIINESINSKQYIPVVLNEVIVSAFYSVRRFLNEIRDNSIETIEKLKTIDIKKCLPFKNTPLDHMRIIAATTFTSIDLISAGTKAAIKNKDNKAGFALDFMQSINYCGIFSLSLSANTELHNSMQKLQKTFWDIAEKQKAKLISALPDGQLDYDAGKYAIETAVSVAGIGTPIGFVSAAIGVYDEIKKAYAELEVAKEERIRIEKECSMRIAVLEVNRTEMEQIVSDYLYNKMTLFANAFDTMDRAITENDIDSFIMGNNSIQNELGKKALFSDMQEFDDLMLSDAEITF